MGQALHQFRRSSLQKIEAKSPGYGGSIYIDAVLVYNSESDAFHENERSQHITTRYWTPCQVFCAPSEVICA
jgi:hypothetical protein